MILYVFPANMELSLELKFFEIDLTSISLLRAENNRLPSFNPYRKLSICWPCNAYLKHFHLIIMYQNFDVLRKKEFPESKNKYYW